MSLHTLQHRHPFFDPTSAPKDVGHGGTDTIAKHQNQQSSIDLPWSFLETIMGNHCHSSPGGPCQSEPFESPMGASSIGSPNSSRDFDEPLITGSDDDNVFHRRPLFDDYVAGLNAGPGFANAPQDDAGWSISGQAAFSYADFFPSGTPVATATSTGVQQKLVRSPTPLTGSQYLYSSQPSPAVAGAVAAFAALQDIAPTLTHAVNDSASLEYASSQMANHVRRLSLSDSVSGYSSSQESVPPGDISRFRFSRDSPEGTPETDSGEDIRQLATVLVQQYHARGRGERDTSELVQALKYAGIEVETGVLASTVSLNSPAPSSLSSFQGPLTHELVPSDTVVYQDICSDISYSPRSSSIHEDEGQSTRKARSSSHSMAKHTALGETSPAASHEDLDIITKAGRRHFRCDVCHKLFDRAFNMKTHRVIHESYREQPYACPFDDCGKRFSRKADCNRHTKSVHLKKGQPLNGRPLAVVVDVG